MFCFEVMQIVLFNFHTVTFLSVAAAKPSSPPSKPAPSGLFGQPGEFHGGLRDNGSNKKNPASFVSALVG